MVAGERVSVKIKIAMQENYFYKGRLEGLAVMPLTFFTKASH